MSDTITLGTIEHVNPADVVVETNVRTTVTLPKEFVASVKEFGVLEPVVCRRGEDGTLSVRMGQRRVLAARKAELTSIPAYVVAGDESTVARLVEQFAENEHRASLTEGERAAVFQQLAFEGLSIPQIVKQTGVKKATVEAGIQVADNAFAQTLTVKHEVTLDQAAALIEFEGDDIATQRLIDTAENQPDQFAHELQRQRDNHARAELVTAEQQRLTEAGFTILENRPEAYWDKEHINIRDLLTADGIPVAVEHLTDVEEKFAHVRSFYTGEVDVAYFVTEPKSHGFKKATTTGTTGPMSDEQKEDRRTLVANNKAWASAETVRRDWLSTFLSRKTLPKDAARFVAIALTSSRTVVASGMSSGNRLAATLLGIDAPTDYWAASPLDALAVDQATKAGQVALAVVLGGMEAATSKETWRRPDATSRRYFEQITAWGYAPSDVERIVTAAEWKEMGPRP